MARGRRDRRHLLHRDRRQARDRARAHRADEGRRDPLQHGPLQRRDRHPGAALARGRDARGAEVRRGVHARRRPADLPARRRPARQHLGRRGPPGDRDGHVLREPGALDRVRRAARGVAREEGLPGADARSTRRSRASSSRRWASRSTRSPRSRRSTWPRGTKAPELPRRRSRRRPSWPPPRAPRVWSIAEPGRAAGCGGRVRWRELDRGNAIGRRSRCR